MPPTFTISSGSERVVEVYPERRGNSSAGSASVVSPTSSDSRSFSSASSDSYIQVEPPYGDEDDIDPEDSASRSRQPTSRRRNTEVRPAPPRRQSSRRVVREREDPPRRHRSHTHHSSRPRRTESRRTPSDESSSVASFDDYPYSHHGAPQPPRAYPPPPNSGYRHVPAHSHGGYPPNMTSAPPYNDPFAGHQAMIPVPHQDPFGYQQPNPFGPHAGQGNPFSPMSQGGSSYFSTDPHTAPQMGPPHRPPGPPRPQSFAAPSQYGSEMSMTPYPPPSAHPGMPYNPYQASSMPQHMQGMAPGMPPGMPGGYPGMGVWPPPSHTSSPAPKEDATLAELESLKAMLQKQQEEKENKAKEQAEKAKEEEKSSTVAELESLKQLIAKHEEARLAAEKERLAKAEEEAAAAAAKKAAEAAEIKRKEEIAAAFQKAKEDAEKAAEEAAKKAKEEHEQKLAEAKKAQEDAEKKQKELEDEAAKNKPTPDSLKAPIRFKDAVGRKFSFPWHLCKTWKGMEGLIRQAFLHIDLIGEHVHQGHYDLTGPDGEIILPQVWDTMIQPDWEITMHMWPMPEPPKSPPKDKLAEDAAAAAAAADPLAGIDFASLGLGDLGGLPTKKASKKGKEGKAKKQKSASPEIVAVPPPPPGHPGNGMPPPPPPMNFPPGMMPDGMGMGMGMPPGIQSVEEKRRSGSKPKSKGLSGWQAWMVGGNVKQHKKK
ncbi:hypothetical protein D0860_02222 [Hortaea werneckii]|uniref:Ubiquitin-like domain-containing protein n=1 Tax=Hortaea werneckii TaxID=91943 RepID=A0A3M7HL99_HORWE|nr:hypothetical protein D0860_02222 [Hortaea werneckii]